MLVLSAPSTMLGAVPPHGGTACVKVASNTTTTEVVVSLAITATRASRGRLTVHVGILAGGAPGDLVIGPSSKDLTALDGGAPMLVLSNLNNHLASADAVP